MAEVIQRYKHQQYQTDACNAVCDVFDGQPHLDCATYVMAPGAGNGPVLLEDIQDAYANQRLLISNERIKKNIQEIQNNNGIPPIDDIVKLKTDGLNLSVEMETGTGKTYVYIKTIHELYRRYGWTKFIVVVPSIAIREGVLSSFDSMAKHFSIEYGTAINCFIYNSNNLEAVETFATSPDIQVMIINAQAFASSKENRIFTTPQPEKFRGRRPIDVVAATNPIIILDEPQSTSGAQTVRRLRDFNPLFTLRYSATHRDVFNLMYRLDSIDAYNKNLVKKIAVKGVSVVGDTATNGYVYVSKIDLQPGRDPAVWLEIDCQGATNRKRKFLRVSERDNLYIKSGELAEYADRWVVTFIDGAQRSVQFENGTTLFEGQSIGDMNQDQMRRVQIRETIKTHLEKEEALFDKNIKVLSLFFIDQVAKYRPDDGIGIYAHMFEEEYNFAVARRLEELGLNPPYEEFLRKTHADTCHDGYFSKDKKGHLKDTSGATEDDKDVYNLIMKNKQRLLSIDEPIRFIFSHSALREGWDNTNVFQICTLKNSDNNTSRRQELGRGMRLCVNQNGDRMDSAEVGDKVHEINVLTVIASETYEQFAKALQQDYAEASKNRTKQISADWFTGKQVVINGALRRISPDDADKIIWHLTVNQYLDHKHNLTEKYYNDVASNVFVCPDGFSGDDIIAILNPVKIQNAGQRRIRCSLNKTNFNKKEFQELWSLINKKSFYTVDFKTEDLVEKSVAALNEHLHVAPLRIRITENRINKITDAADLNATRGTTQEENVATPEINLAFDLIGEIAKGTSLTRRAVADILMKIQESTFAMFKTNPQDFIKSAIHLINTQKATTVIEHIEYNALADCFSTDIFTRNDLILADRSFETPNNHIYDHIMYQSQGEREMAQELETNADVCVYAKLPGDFFIRTPMGKYNPDWAIAFKQGAVKHVYFVAETKGVHNSLDVNMKTIEESKAICAKRHFAAICKDKVKYGVVKNYEDIINIVKG